MVHELASEEPGEDLGRAVGIVLFGGFEARAVNEIAVLKEAEQEEGGEQGGDAAHG